MTTQSNQKSQINDFIKSSPLNLIIFFLGGIFFIILFVALYLARDIVIPFTFALLFNYFLSPAILFFKKIYIPVQISAAIMILLIMFIFGGGLYLLSKPAMTWINKGPEIASKIDQELTALANDIAKPVKFFSIIKERISSFTNKTNIESKNNNVTIDIPIIGSVFNTTWQLLLEASITLLLLYFLLISRFFILSKIIHRLASQNKKQQTSLIVHEIEKQIWKYLFARTAINIVLAIVVSILMYLFGMPDPILWGVMAGLLEFIPYLGALVSTVVIGLVALFTFNTLGYSVLVTLSFFIVVIIESNFIFPIVIGRTILLSPIVVLLSLLFWGWIWGIAGAFLAIPLMVVIKIIFENLYKASFMNEILSD